MPVLEPAPWNAVGLKTWAKAATNRTTCCFCKLAIPKGSVWFSYRFKMTHQLSDQLRLHSGCPAEMPAGTRARDINVLHVWLADPALDADAKSHSEVALAMLS